MKFLIKILIAFLLFVPAITNAQKTTAVGVGLIKYYEGLRTKSYLCSAGVLTIGFGHTGSDVFAGQIITELQAEQLLIRDLGRFERYVDKTILRVMKWHEFDALISFTFNVGYRIKDELRFAINTGNTAVVVSKLRLYNKAKVNGVYIVLPGLARRRNSEAYLYENAKIKLFGKFL
jgi:lysozyme